MSSLKFDASVRCIIHATSFTSHGSLALVSSPLKLVLHMIRDWYTKQSYITTGHSDFLEPTLILIMRIVWNMLIPNHTKFLIENYRRPHLMFSQKINVVHLFILYYFYPTSNIQCVHQKVSMKSQGKTWGLGPHFNSTLTKKLVWPTLISHHTNRTIQCSFSPFGLINS